MFLRKITLGTGSKCCKASKHGLGLKIVAKLKWREIVLRYKFSADFVSYSLILFVKIINRYRSIRFSETQIGFEIPRILATSDIAVRLLHTHYDHVTPLWPVLTPLQERVATVTDSVKDEVKNGEAEISDELQEENKPQDCESVSVHEEETTFEEEGDIEVQTVGHTFFNVYILSSCRNVLVSLETFLRFSPYN